MDIYDQEILIIHSEIPVCHVGRKKVHARAKASTYTFDYIR
jgi:hypothetical protein